MSEVMKAGWMGIIVLAATLAGAQTAPDTSGTSSSPPGLPFADGSVQEGAEKAATCVACHGVNGNSITPTWPTLAGQSAIYTAEQLRLFRAGVRNDPVMMPMAMILSDEDIADLAVYFQAQTPAGLEADPSYWKAGEALYRSGSAERNIPACIACHGPVGRGNPASGYPAVRAQHATYTMKQLTDYSNGTRYGGAQEDGPQSRNGAMMQTIAQRLTPEDIRDLASYIQGMR